MTFDLNESCKGLLNHPFVMICYILNDKGNQINDPVYGIHSIQNLNYRFGKLGKTNGVNWSRRVYFQKALANPMSIQKTRPYLSLASGQMCSTLSIALEIKSETYILCCDVRLS